jgi:hypothetical protein
MDASRFRRLPGEIKNMIYKLVCSEELLFGGATCNVDHCTATNLSGTNRQIYQEFGLFPYLQLALHIYDWYPFIKWLRRLTPDQLAAITKLNTHLITFFNLSNNINFTVGELSHTVRLKTLLDLGNLRIAHVHIHPYRPRHGPAPIDPRFVFDSSNRILWDLKAEQIARTLSNQLRHINCRDVPTLGQWSYPVSSYKYDLMKICWDSGTLYRDGDANWQCLLGECRWLWIPRRRL